DHAAQMEGITEGREREGSHQQDTERDGRDDEEYRDGRAAGPIDVGRYGRRWLWRRQPGVAEPVVGVRFPEPRVGATAKIRRMTGRAAVGHRHAPRWGDVAVMPRHTVATAGGAQLGWPCLRRPWVGRPWVGRPWVGRPCV